MAYKEQFGHCEVPKNHTTPDGIRLGRWLQNQRKQAKKPNYSSERREHLEALGVRLTTKSTEPAAGPKQRTPSQSTLSFSDNLTQLTAFANAHGSCDVPHDHALFQWCQEQIQAANDGLLSPDQLQQLIDVGLIEHPGDSRRMAMRG